jgi:hypothetical protein
VWRSIVYATETHGKGASPWQKVPTFLLGNVGKDPEIRSTAGGMIVASFSLATADRQKDGKGNWIDKAEWRDQGFGCTGAGAEVDAECIGVDSFTMAAAPGSSRSFR